MKLMKTIITFPLLLGMLSSSQDFSEDCQELFEENIHPKECCNYPIRKILDIDSEKCKSICKDVKTNPPGCCELDCIYAITGVYKNEEFISEAVITLFENFLEENGGGKYDKWMEIVEKSMEICSKAVEKTSDILICNIPEYIMDFIDCVDSQNFLNCPNFKATKPCNKTRSIVENESKCGIKTGDIFIINHKFWNDRKEEN